MSNTQGCTVLTPEALTLLESTGSPQLVLSLTWEKQALQKDLTSSKIDKIKYKLIQKEDNDNEGKGFKLQPQSFPI